MVHALKTALLDGHLLSSLDHRWLWTRRIHVFHVLVLTPHISLFSIGASSMHHYLFIIALSTFVYSFIHMYLEV